MEIDLTSKILICELYAWMDGGSVTLICKNDLGQHFEIEFVQSVILNPRIVTKIPGRLYFDKKLVSERSDLEKVLLKNLEEAEMKNLTELDMQILEERIKYVKSDQYLIDSKETEKLKFK